MDIKKDLGGPQVLTNILSVEELEQTPQVVEEQFKKYLEGFFDEYYKDKAAANRLRNVFEESFEDSQEVHANQSKIQKKVFNSGQNEDILDILREVRANQTAILEGQNAIVYRLDVLEAGKTRIIENQAILSDMQDAMVTNQETIAKKIDDLKKSVIHQTHSPQPATNFNVSK